MPSLRSLRPAPGLSVAPGPSLPEPGFQGGRQARGQPQHLPHTRLQARGPPKAGGRLAARAASTPRAPRPAAEPPRGASVTPTLSGALASPRTSLSPGCREAQTPASASPADPGPGSGRPVSRPRSARRRSRKRAARPRDDDNCRRRCRRRCPRSRRCSARVPRMLMSRDVSKSVPASGRPVPAGRAEIYLHGN